MKKWLPMRLVEPGTKFYWEGQEFLRIKTQVLISKSSVNCVNLSTGHAELGFISSDTAVEVDA